MKEMTIKRGQPITFRVPSDTPDHMLKQLSKLRETERRNFSSTIASIVMAGVGDSLSRQRETITIPLPKGLTKEQRDWLKHEHSEALLGNIVYHLLDDPLRAVSILASLNSNELEIDKALYLQEEIAVTQEKSVPERKTLEQTYVSHEEHIDTTGSEVDDLDNIHWNIMKSIEEESVIEEDLDEDPLADFLAQMNK